MEQHSSPERKREKLGSMSVVDNCALTPPLTPQQSKGRVSGGVGAQLLSDLKIDVECGLTP